MINSSTIPYYEGTKEFMELGYVPLDRNGSAGSLTLGMLMMIGQSIIQLY